MPWKSLQSSARSQNLHNSVLKHMSGTASLRAHHTNQTERKREREIDKERKRERKTFRQSEKETRREKLIERIRHRKKET